jgi:tRNA(Ser,Leu) C12 N-acetylase TAN1
MISDIAKNTIKIFHPSQDLNEAIDEVVLEWLDGKLSKIEDRVREFERKYSLEFHEFDAKIKRQGASFEEEDDWIDWGDYIDLLKALNEYRREILSRSKRP